MPFFHRCMMHTLRFPRALVVLVLTLCLGVIVGHSADGWARKSAQPQIPKGYARLLVITNFENTEVQINNVSYPYEYIYADQQGVLLPADMPLRIRVSVSETKSRTYNMTLKSGEMRVIVSDLKNKGEVIAAPKEDAPAEKNEEEKEEDPNGYLGVSSSPRGTVFVDDSNTGQQTPARRIELEPGRHRVQIQYIDDNEMSETKYVLIRKGTNTNVFFRKRPTQAGGD